MRNLILGLSLSVAFIVGCLVGPVVQPTLAPPVRAAPGAQRWEYRCFSSGNNAETQRNSNQLGAAGFELAAAGNRFADESIWCFKRRRP